MKNHLIAIAVTAIAVTGCAAPPASAPQATEDLNVGIAATCTPTAVDMSAANTSTATIVMTNDGWCALHTKQKDGKPFLLGLVKANAAHGRILIQKIGGETRIEYTADERYVGADKFTVALRPTTPNTPDASIQVAVNVSMGEHLPPVEPQKTSPAPRATTPARAARPTAR